MFEQRERLIVLSSSVSSKDTGPRKGSIGYFISTSDIYRNNKHDVCVSEADIIFSRYGYEKKHRAERKKVIILFPSTKYGDIVLSTRGRELVEKVNSAKSGVVEDIRGMERWSHNNLHVIVAAPSQTNILKLDEEELVCWAVAFLHGEISRSVTRMTGSGYYVNSTFKGLSVNSLWNKLLHAGADRGSMGKLLTEISTFDKNKLKEFIEITSAMSAIGRRSAGVSAINNMSSFLVNEIGYIDKARQDPILIEGINSKVFSSTVITALEKAVEIKKLSGDAHNEIVLENVLRNFKSLINEFKSMSAEASVQ